MERKQIFRYYLQYTTIMVNKRKQFDLVPTSSMIILGKYSIRDIITHPAQPCHTIICEYRYGGEKPLEPAIYILLEFSGQVFGHYKLLQCYLPTKSGLSRFLIKSPFPIIVLSSDQTSSNNTRTSQARFDLETMLVE